MKQDTTREQVAKANMPKLQRRKVSALKAVFATICCVSFATGAKMDVFAAKEDALKMQYTLVCYCTKKPEPPTEVKTWEEQKTSYVYSEEELLAMYRTVQGEAGAESLRGKTAVAAVILNRFFGENAFRQRDSVVSVVYAPNQFAPSWQSLEWFKKNNPEVIKAVNYACQGYDPTAEVLPGGALYFHADWTHGEYGVTSVLEFGNCTKVVIDRQAYY